MDSKESSISRRGSLAISALLNDDTSQDQTSSDLSPVLSSGATSPTMSNTTSKAKRKRISPAQYNRLMEIFDQTDTPSSEIRENLADELNMTKREVQVWFQNRRAKMNRTKNHQTKRHSIPSTTHLPNNGRYSSTVYPDCKQQQPYPPSPPINGRYPIAPLPPRRTSTVHNPHLPQQPYHPYRHQRNPSAIDLLASAAEYVRTDRKALTFSRT